MANKNFDEKNASSDELYSWCIEEYKSLNVISRYLINNFYLSLAKKVLKNILHKVENFLEIGCGAAESTLRILPIIGNIKYEATEYDERYIEAINKRNLPFKVTQENVYNIKRSNATYDCVIMLEVLEHLENYDIALKELFRVSSKYVIISVPNEPLWRILNLMRFKYIKNLGNTPGHINHWNKNSLKKLLSRYGEVKTIVTPLPWIIMLIEKN